MQFDWVIKTQETVQLQHLKGWVFRSTLYV